MTILKVRRVCCVFIVFLCFVSLVRAQMESASLSGRVTDPQGAVVPHTIIEAIENNTNIKTTTETNDAGLYYLSSLRPGSYRLVVSKDGFRQIIQADVVLHVQDVLTLNFGLQIGSVNETITVTGGTPLLNTESAAVSTVVDRNFVENIPLNGRSFQDLILLTPGVVTTSPQSSAALGAMGEFSVNGQRTEENYYSVDGVSANVGVSPGNVQYSSTSGSLPFATVMGTTQALVSVDALEEFRVQTSTYSAEYGRTPGGQFSFLTRSGTNDWHGTAFDYLRNDLFDANNWFNDHYSQPKPALRQSDFGGTLGGPIEFPKLYDGKDRTFFFLSYEGLRLTQPQEAAVQYVPTVSLRASTPVPLQQVLNAFPLPNCPGSNPSCSNDLGNGLGEFIGSWSNPGQIDSTSVRLDHSLNKNVKLFFRFSSTSSNAETHNSTAALELDSNAFTTRTYTFGVTNLFSSEVGNEFRLNYSSNAGASSSTIESFGGGSVVNLAQLQGVNTGMDPAYSLSVYVAPPGYDTGISEGRQLGLQRQWNFVDTLSVSRGHHQTKFGFDYRRLTPFQQPASPNVLYFYLSSASVEANSVDFGLASTSSASRPVYNTFSAFAQDEWRITPRLSLSMGLRWEVNPAPGDASGNLPYTARGSSLSTLALAPEGTPLWSTTWFNFAPRLGVAYVLGNRPSYETVIRGGSGVFFDTGQQSGSFGYQGPGFSAINDFGFFYGSPTAFPAGPLQAYPTIVNPPVPPYAAAVSYPEHLQLPYTLHWNASIQQSLGKSQALTISYVGENGRRLLGENLVNVAPFNPSFGLVYFFKTGLTSDYDALQVQFQRRLSHNLQALASYTWSHSIDYGSQNVERPELRGNSDFDVRHNLASAVSYEFPNAFRSRPLATLLHHWAIDGRLSARTGFPVTLNGQVSINPTNGQQEYDGLNVVSGQPLYLYGSQYPGGRAINPAAFSLPASGQFGDAPRNFVRGFGAWQADFAVRRDFPICDRLKLRFRAEAFNLFNHPDFGQINASYGNALFGQATATLAQSLGVLSPLYQMGGPRSMQFALKFEF